jgi:hypothetical protein
LPPLSTLRGGDLELFAFLDLPSSLTFFILENGSARGLVHLVDTSWDVLKLPSVLALQSTLLIFGDLSRASACTHFVFLGREHAGVLSQGIWAVVCCVPIAWFLVEVGGRMISPDSHFL